MLAIAIILAILAIPSLVIFSCCVVSGQADRRAAEIFKRREGRSPGESHNLTSAGSTPAPATTPTEP